MYANVSDPFAEKVILVPLGDDGALLEDEVAPSHSLRLLLSFLLLKVAVNKPTAAIAAAKEKDMGQFGV